MPVYKDTENNTWYCKFYYNTWDGMRKQTTKRGFSTKKAAQNWENNTKAINSLNINVSLRVFTDMYFRDKEGELKARTIKNKRYMIERHIFPFWGDKKINTITPAEIVQWQNTMRKQGYSETYLRMIQNQLTALFTHASNVYGLQNNPCKKIKKMGKSDANKLDYWTKKEYDAFIDTLSKKDRYFTLFELLFWTGIREGDDDDKIRLNQRKPSKYKGLRRFGPEKNLQRINKFMKERPIFYKNLIQMKENIRFYLRCFYCITKVMILQFNSENRTELARNG